MKPAARQWSNILKIPKQRKHESRISYLVELTFTVKEHKLTNMQELRKYRCPTLFLRNPLQNQLKKPKSLRSAVCRQLMNITDLLAELKLCDFIKHTVVKYTTSTYSDINLTKREEMGRIQINNTISLLTMLKAFIWKQKDNTSIHMIENKERRGKKRLISNFTTAHSRKSIDKRGKK